MRVSVRNVRLFALFGVLVAVLLCTVPAPAQENLSGTTGPDDHAGLKGEYYDNLDFTNLKLTRTDPTVNFSWGAGSPDPSIAPDTFSVRWSGQVKADHTQTYTFYTTTNDGARLSVGGQQIINRWSDGIATNTGTISLQAGQWYPITMEYYEGINTASAKLEYSSASEPRKVIPQTQLRSPSLGEPTLTCNKGTFLAQYRNELKTFNTQPVLTRCEPAVNHDWGSGSPGSGVNADSFTARWVGTFDFEASGYEFTATSDDGIRLWVDGQLLIDQWKDQAAATYKATKTMTAGEHEVKVEYYENTGLAVDKVSWAKVSSPPPDCSSSLQSLINNAPAGSTLTLGNCTYREAVTVNKALTLDGGGQTSIRGSDVWTNFSSSSGNWVSSQNVPSFGTESAQCASGSNGRCKRPEQVFIDGTQQQQIATGGDPAVGQFALNSSRQIVLGSDPAGKTVEVTTRASWLKTAASGVTVQGFDMRHAGNLEGTGGVENKFFDNFTLKNSTLQYAHAANTNFWESKNILLDNVKLLYSGHSGIGAGKTQIAVVGGEIAHNNTEDYDPYWAAAGSKMTQSRTDVTGPAIRIDGVEVHNNNGPGLWFDISANNILVENNRIHNNKNLGIFYEVSSGAEIRNNVLYNNGDPNDSWVYGGQIGIMNSSNANVHDNVAAWGGDGIVVTSVYRTDWPAYNNTTGVKVHHNTILRNLSGANVSALHFWQGWAGTLYNASSGNQGYDNKYWYPTAEDGNYRFRYQTSYTSLASFNATGGEERGYYLTDAEKDALLATHNIPPP